MIFRFLTVSLMGVVLASSALAESADSVLALSTDNDLFAPTQTDRDYTAGVAITYSSNSEDFIGNPVSRVSQGLDSFVLPYLGQEEGSPRLSWGFMASPLRKSRNPRLTLAIGPTAVWSTCPQARVTRLSASIRAGRHP